MSYLPSACVPQPTRKERFIRWLFPFQFNNRKFSPDFQARDCVHSSVTTEWSFVDRIRILITGRTRIEVAVECENVVGRTVTNSVSYVLPPRRLEK